MLVSFFTRSKVKTRRRRKENPEEEQTLKLVQELSGNYVNFKFDKKNESGGIFTLVKFSHVGASYKHVNIPQDAADPPSILSVE